MYLAHGSAPLGGGALVVGVGETLVVGVGETLVVGVGETLVVGVGLVFEDTASPPVAGGVDGVHCTSEPARTPPSTSINVLRIAVAEVFG